MPAERIMVCLIALMRGDKADLLIVKRMLMNSIRKLFIISRSNAHQTENWISFFRLPLRK